jgi:hypothetical protein
LDVDYPFSPIVARLYRLVRICTAPLDERVRPAPRSRFDRGHAIAARIQPYKAGRLVNELKDLAETIDPLPRVERSPDPTDDFLLALSEAGQADCLITGDKSGLLSLARHAGTLIMSAGEFATLSSSGY